MIALSHALSVAVLLGKNTRIPDNSARRYRITTLSAQSKTVAGEMHVHHYSLTTNTICRLNAMQREPIDSEVIASIGYDAAWHVLEIEYRQTQEIYEYFDVPPEECTAFHSAESKGTYLNTVFKPRGYRYVRVE